MNLKKFIGKTLNQTVKEVKKSKDFIPEFAVATKKDSNVIDKVEDGAYHLVSNTKGMDIYMIETNARQKKVTRMYLGNKRIENAWFKTSKGYHKLTKQTYVNTGYNNPYGGGKEQVPTFKREK